MWVGFWVGMELWTFFISYFCQRDSENVCMSYVDGRRCLIKWPVRAESRAHATHAHEKQSPRIHSPFNTPPRMSWNWCRDYPRAATSLWLKSLIQFGFLSKQHENHQNNSSFISTDYITAVSAAVDWNQNRKTLNDLPLEIINNADISG